jgi:hypothetical protein
VIRQCSRTGCAEQATATFAYDYRSSQVWLSPLYPERDPHAYDLCTRHANRLAAPSGWTLEDLRKSMAPRLAS